MSKAISLHSRLRPRLAVEPIMLALVVAGGVGAYAFRNTPGTAAMPRAEVAPKVALAIGFAADARHVAAIQPVQAQQALLQTASFQPAPQALGDSFQSAFRPMTAAVRVRQPLVAPVEAAVPVAELRAPVREAAALAAATPLAMVEQGAMAASIEAEAELIPVAAAPAPVEMGAPAEPSLPDPVAAAPQLAVPVAEPVPAPPSAALQRLEALENSPPAALAPVAVEAQAAAAAPAARAVPEVALAAIPVARVAVAAKAAPVRANSPQPRAPLAKAAPARTKAALAAGPQITSRYKLVDGGVETQIGVQFYGQRLGAVPLRVLGNGVPSLKLGDLLGLLKDRMEPERYQRLSTSGAADEFISLERLRSTGIPVRYDAARDELKLGEE